MSPEWLSPEETARALHHLEEQFGIPPEALSGHRLVRRGEYVCAVRSEAEEICEQLEWLSAGLRLLRVTGDRFKLTTRGAQVFGARAVEHVHEVDRLQLRALIEGRSVPCGSEPGLTILRHRGRAIGLGLVRAGQLVSQLPRSVTEHVRMPPDQPASSNRELHDS